MGREGFAASEGMTRSVTDAGICLNGATELLRIIKWWVGLSPEQTACLKEDRPCVSKFGVQGLGPVEFSVLSFQSVFQCRHWLGLE